MVVLDATVLDELEVDAVAMPPDVVIPDVDLLRVPQVYAVARRGLPLLARVQHVPLDQAPAGIREIDPEKRIFDAIIRNVAEGRILDAYCRAIVDEAAADIAQREPADRHAVCGDADQLAFSLTVQHGARLALECDPARDLDGRLAVDASSDEDGRPRRCCRHRLAHGPVRTGRRDDERVA